MIASQSCLDRSAGLPLPSALAGLGLVMAVRKKKKGIKPPDFSRRGAKESIQKDCLFIPGNFLLGIDCFICLYSCMVQGLQATLL